MAYLGGAEVSARDIRDGYPLLAVAQADTAVNQTIDWEVASGLTIICAPDTLYAIHGYIAWSAVPPGIRIGLTVPPNALGRWGMQCLAPDPFSDTGAGQSTATTSFGPDNVGSTGGGLSTAAQQYGILRGFLQTGSDPGSIQLIFTQAFAISTFVTINAGSWITLSKIGNT